MMIQLVRLTIRFLNVCAPSQKLFNNTLVGFILALVEMQSVTSHGNMQINMQITWDTID